MIPASLYGIGYTAHGFSGKAVQATFPLFVWSLLTVPAAGSASTLLLLWEIMALSSLVLVLAEHRHNPEVRPAAQWYAAMTHLGFVAILVALTVLASRAGGDWFPAMRSGSGRVGRSRHPLSFSWRS